MTHIPNTKKGFTVQGNYLTLCFHNGAKESGHIIIPEITPGVFDRLTNKIRDKIAPVNHVIQTTSPGSLKQFWMMVRDDYLDQIDLIAEAEISWQKLNGMPYKDDSTFACRG